MTPPPDAIPPPLAWNAAGEGPPVVLVHGALADRRLWTPHLPHFSRAGFRAVAVTLPHHGPLPLPEDPRPFGLRAHADGLASFLETLGAPAHLVAWSYAAHAALLLAVERPELLRSVFVYEPGIPTYLESDAEKRAFGEDVQALFSPVVAALSAGEHEAALAALIDGSSSRDGAFAAQAPEVQQLERDNVHTLPRLMQQSPPPVLTKVQLAAITVPTCVAYGERTRPAYSVVSRAAQAAIPSHALTVPGVGHMWPAEAPEAFTDAVLAFLSGR